MNAQLRPGLLERLARKAWRNLSNLFATNRSSDATPDAGAAGVPLGIAELPDAAPPRPKAEASADAAAPIVPEASDALSAAQIPAAETAAFVTPCGGVDDERAAVVATRPAEPQSAPNALIEPAPQSFAATAQETPPPRQRAAKPRITMRPRKRLGETVATLRKAKARRAPDAPEVPAAGDILYGAYSGAPGARDYALFVPANPAPAADSRLLVMLHGCMQEPDDFAAGTDMNRIAAERGWHALYPAQPRRANFNKCWNWFDPADQTRARGEPAILAAMMREIMAERDLRSAAIAGLSAGGAMAIIMGQVFPELFDAVMSHSGVAYGVADDATTAFSVMRSGPDRIEKREFGPRLMVVQGEDDTIVAPANADAIVTSIAGRGEARTSHEPGARAVTRKRWMNEKGKPRLVELKIAGLGHAWSGGKAEGSFVDPLGPDVSREFAEFVAQ